MGLPRAYTLRQFFLLRIGNMTQKHLAHQGKIWYNYIKYYWRCLL